MSYSQRCSDLCRLSVIQDGIVAHLPHLLLGQKRNIEEDLRIIYSLPFPPHLCYAARVYSTRQVGDKQQAAVSAFP